MTLKSPAYLHLPLRLPMPLLAAVALFLAALAACHRAPDARLALADSLMEARPDSALAVLDSIPSASLSSASDRALHALLLTQARHKNYIDETSDSLISTAVDYFSTHSIDSLLMRALYYHAIIQRNAGCLESAISSVTEARDIAQRLGKKLWEARSCELSGDIFNDAFAYGDAIANYKKAAMLHRSLNRKPSELAAWLYLAAAFSNDHKNSECIRLCDSLLNLNLGSDSIFIAECLRLQLAAYSEKYDFRKVDSLYSLLNGFADILPVSDGSKIYYAKSLLASGQYDRAANILDSIAPDDLDYGARLDYYAALHNYYLKKKDFSNFARTYDSLYTIQLSAARDRLSSPITDIQRDFYQEKRRESDAEALRRKRVLFFTVGVAVCLLVLGLVGYYIFRMRWRLKQRENELNILAIDELSQKLTDLITRTSQLEADILLKDKQISEIGAESQQRVANLSSDIALNKTLTERLASERHALALHSLMSLSLLCDKFFSDADISHENSGLYEKVRKDYSDFISTRDLDEIIEWIDYAYCGQVSTFTSAFDNLTPDEIQLFALSVAGMSPRAISFLCKTKLNTVYTKRRRLRTKIDASNAPNKHIFLRVL